MKTLHLLRHAKSDWSDESLDDHDRPLNARGRRTLGILAEHVAGWKVDLVLTSSAVRARSTAEAVAGAVDARLHEERALYNADARDVLDVIRAVPDDVEAAMIVGHKLITKDSAPAKTKARRKP